MSPKLVSDDRRNIVIRPLAYVRESQIKAYAALKAFPIIPCNLCGSQPNMQRQNVKAMLQQWDKSYPGRVQNILNGLSRVSASHLLDPKLFDFARLTVEDAESLDELDLGFDAEDIQTQNDASLELGWN